MTRIGFIFGFLAGALSFSGGLHKMPPVATGLGLQLLEQTEDFGFDYIEEC